MRRLLIGLVALLVLVLAPAKAQSPAGRGYSQDELDQLLAPIALYPDDLLMQVLIAATYPLEVVEAARFVQQNPNLSGDALDQALAEKRWDPSVQSLAAFPQVLAMMSDKLEWMQRLGDAFLVDQQRVMDTAQALRRKAEAAGNLHSTPQQSVIDQAGQIIIAPEQPDVVYVPVYDPLIVYGPWWAPAYPPWYWYPPPIYGYPVGVFIASGIYFGRAWSVSHHHWGWAHADWHGHHVNVDVTNNRFWNHPGRPAPHPGGDWQHVPEHRRGIAYPNPSTRDYYRNVDPNAVRARQNFRGYDLPRPAPYGQGASSSAGRPPPSYVQPAPRTVRPSPAPRAASPPFDPGLSRQQAQMNSQRGFQSRQSIGPIAPPANRAPVPMAAPQSRAPAVAPAPQSRAPSAAPVPGRVPSAPPVPRGGGRGR